jgi:hypothetical protein
MQWNSGHKLHIAYTFACPKLEIELQKYIFKVIQFKSERKEEASEYSDRGMDGFGQLAQISQMADGQIGKLPFWLPPFPPRFRFRPPFWHLSAVRNAKPTQQSNPTQPSQIQLDWATDNLLMDAAVAAGFHFPFSSHAP